MIRSSILTALCVFAIIFTSCNDDAEITASIVGKWAGTEANFKINPTGVIPAFSLNEQPLNVQLDFKSDGKLILTDNKGVTQNGSYILSGNKLTINVDYTFELIELTGVYTIKELTTSTLSAEIERQGSYTHPDTGQQFDGTVIATLNFSKTGN
jgi:uncharacterized protein (TIGR03066 family)